MQIIKPLLTIWGELIEALHGVNGFGSNVAELYAYRFLPYSPLIHGRTNEQTRQYWTEGNSLHEAFGKEAATAAYEIFSTFEKTYNCKLEIGDRNNWEPISSLINGYFDSRIHVKVTKN